MLVAFRRQGVEMDRRERLEDLDVSIRGAIDSALASTWSAVQGIVQSFDAEKMTCVVQPTTMGRQTVIDAKGLTTVKMVNMPLLLDCPVVFQGGGGMTLTFPIKAGDEALVILADRCIDGWWQTGKISPPLDVRIHDLSDGFALVGLRSLPRVLTSISTTDAQLRSDDGMTIIGAKPGTITLMADTIVCTGTITLDGDVEITGDLVTDGTITGAAPLTIGGTVVDVP
jgi:hypothetical protein